MVTEELQKKQDHLEAYLKQLGSVVLAFSGGVDSTYLMHEARKVLGDRAMAVTMNLASVPEREVADAIAYCQKEGIRQEVVKMDQFGIEGFAENPSNRCYLCKHFLFSSLKKIAEKEGFAYVIDGTNLNDASQYRPGSRPLGNLASGALSVMPASTRQTSVPCPKKRVFPPGASPPLPAWPPVSPMAKPLRRTSSPWWKSGRFPLRQRFQTVPGAAS